MHLIDFVASFSYLEDTTYGVQSQMSGHILPCPAQFEQAQTAATRLTYANI